MDAGSKKSMSVPYVERIRSSSSLLAFLLRHVKGKSRNNIKSMLARGQVSVDGRTATRFDHPVAVGSRVAVKAHVEEEVPGLPFPILYEDRDILVIDKPAGLLHPGGKGEGDRGF